jgi:hypothetical protein
MAAYDPPNGDGGYFQYIGPVWEREEQGQVVVLLDESIGIYQRSTHRQITDDARSFHFHSFNSQSQELHVDVKLEPG